MKTGPMVSFSLRSLRIFRAIFTACSMQKITHLFVFGKTVDVFVGA